MGRTLKKVPMDFDWPINEIWPGYMVSMCNAMDEYHKDKTEDERCKMCKHFAKLMKIKLADYGCPECPLNPPKGKGFQLWETVTEGSPQSPVFESLDKLCEWCEENATTFADYKATKDKWKEMLVKDDVHHKVGNCIFK